MPKPLADQLRPEKLEDIVGQDHLLGANGPLRKLIKLEKLPSLILWGPPGTGKTTIARVIAKSVKADFVPFSAVTGGIADVRKIIREAKRDKGFFNRDTILFIDEIHRFNKAQQDGLLPHVEDGSIILIGATTENPGFYVNAPLLSRATVYRLNQLEKADLKVILGRSLEKFPDHRIDNNAQKFLIKQAEGDARKLIGFIELAASLSKKITLQTVEQVVQQKSINYDKTGDQHYGTISAFIKSMRGGDVNATLHYLARMVIAGEDPRFIARRLVIFASEDIGNANPQALILANACLQSVAIVGLPESQLILAQTATYLANSKKSIASTLGLGKAKRAIEEKGTGKIPKHLLNPSNKVNEQEGYGEGHVRYPWLEERRTGKKIKQQYLPDEHKEADYYREDWE